MGGTRAVFTRLIPYLTLHTSRTALSPAAEDGHLETWISSMNIRCSRLSCLPQELLSEILHHLDDDADLICLALTCRHFLSILEKQVRAALQTDAAPWVGDRIILLRDYAYGLPDSSLSEPEESELSLRKQEGVEDDQEELASPRRPYYHAEDQYDYARRRRIYKSVNQSRRH